MAAKKKTAKKARKVEELSQAHGKIEEFEPSTLDQIWGSDGTETYNTLDEENYLQQLNGMAKVDMQAHATKVGLIPIDNMDILKQRLVKQFKTHVNSYRRPKVKASNNPKMTKEIRNILGEGK